MGFLNRQWLERTLLLATVVAIMAAFTSNALAQEYDTAYVPFLVNADATVKAELKEGATVLSQAQMSVTAGNQAILRIPLQKTDGVRFFGTQRQANVPAIISNRNGKVTINLPAQSYKSAEVLLYTINGKRVLRSNVSASNTANSITRPNLAIGIYLLSVRGLDGDIVTSRLTHGGGSLDINVAFGGENLRQTAKSAATGYWTITVTAAEAGYVGVSYPFSPVAGTNNELQNITLHTVPDGEYAVTVSSVGTGASGSGSYVDGATVTITAGTAPTGQRFKNWTSTSAGVNFADSNRATTTFTMPANAVTITANFEPNTYKVTVLSTGAGADGSGDYSPGATVNITAGTASNGFMFNGWASSNGDVVFANATSAMTTFIMPPSAVTVWASFSGGSSGGGAPAVMFLIDHSGSMVAMGLPESGRDTLGNRFRVTMALVDTIYKVYPDAEVGVAVFAEGLVLNGAWDRNLVPFGGVTHAAGGPNQSYLPLRPLYSPAVDGGYTSYDSANGAIAWTGEPLWINAIHGMFNVPSRNTAHSTLRNGATGGKVDERAGTNISIAFEAALEAFETTKIPKDNRYIIFLSDGGPELYGYGPGGENGDCGKYPNLDPGNERCKMQYDFIAGTNVPTTHTLFLTTSGGAVPPMLTEMMENIGKNGYSESNPSSSIVAMNSDYGGLLRFIMENIVSKMLYVP